MNTLTAPSAKSTERAPVDYTSRDYWNGLIKMSMSKFFVLCVINQKSMHGYEISKTVGTITNGCCAPTPGALYPVLREFEEGGYVTIAEQVVQGRARKVYSITDKGRQAFSVAAEAWLDIGNCITASLEGRCDTDGCC